MIIIIICWFGLFFLAACKMLFDQYQLLKRYRAEMDPTYPVVPGEKPDLKEDPLGIKVSMRWLKITFSKYPRNPGLDKAARKVRIDLLSGVAIAIGGFLLIAIAILLEGNTR